MARVMLDRLDPRLAALRMEAERRGAFQPRRAEPKPAEPPKPRRGYCYRCGTKRVPLWRSGRPKKHDCLLVPLPMDRAEDVWANEPLADPDDDSEG